ncbi:GTP-binding protein [Hydrogenophaga sp.]|uniref:CobW family GTP-binding protein n=1 Tax=Hydrogenophaga sp. TaxID=1904254 RepID=UPI00271E4E97|nr:GTP-binding protein [Hydrogenophaga sp.]MDO9436361.1 GTP-binding protein [Hydrogenophaga sp.]
MTGSSPRLPLHLVTGFLGAGKTTLVNAVLRDPAFAGTMVIVNEFGEVGLDHLLVSEGKDQVVLLDSGCLCCAASGSLRDTLIDLFARRGSGSVPAFDRIIVETSGLAHPAPLIATVLGDSAIAPRCELVQVLTLVDAVVGARTLERHAEARAQVALADRLLMTKSEQADADATRELNTLLQRLAPFVPVALGEPSMPVASFFDDARTAGSGRSTNLHGLQVEAFLRGPLRGQYGDDSGLVDTRDANDEDPVHGASRALIRSSAWRVPTVPQWADYANWVHTLTARFGARLLRCKGLLAVGDDPQPWVVQGVQGYFAAPQRLARWPTDIHQGFVVCIGESLAADELASAMALLGATAPVRALPITERSLVS